MILSMSSKSLKMANKFKHFILITRHRHRVIKNAAHMGIFWHSLKHDLTKYGWKEFMTSSKYYVGDHSPVYEERLHNNYFSSVCQHHTKRNGHHWEYWADFFGGHILAKRMPWKYAVEYVCDVLSASYTYNPKEFKPDSAYKYFEGKKDHYFINKGTVEFVSWCLKTYAESGWKNLHKKQTKTKYEEICQITNEVDIFETELPGIPFPKLKE